MTKLDFSSIYPLLPIEEELSNLNPMTVDMVGDLIETANNKNISCTELVRLIMNIAEYRLSNAKSYVALCAHLIQKMPHHFYRAFIRFFSPKISRLLFQAGLINVNDILEYGNQYPDIFFWFPLEIGIPVVCRSSKYFKYIVQNFKHYKENDYKVYRELLEYGYELGTPELAIKNDSINELVFLSSSPGFDFNCDVPPNGFNTRDRMNYIQLSAFYGSEHSFKFLILNGCEVNLKVARCSVIGGNLGIVRLCEQNGCTFEDCLDSAIIAHRNDIFDWIISTKKSNKPSLSVALDYLGYKALTTFEREDIEEFNRDNKVVWQICDTTSTSIAKFFINNGFDFIKEINNSDLVKSMHYGAIDFISFILDSGYNINKVETNFAYPTLIHHAADIGDDELYEFLLSKGANENSLTIFELSARVLRKQRQMAKLHRSNCRI